MNKTLFTYLFFILGICNANAQNSTTPDYLKKRDTIIILAPAGIVKPTRKATILKAKKLAESWGLHVILGEHIFNQRNHFAGTDIERASDFQKALDNTSIKAIWVARGGYGSVRILDKLNFTRFKQHPKWIIGYSDITAFHNHIHNLGIETIHGMMATSLEFNVLQNKKSIRSLHDALFGKKVGYEIENSVWNRLKNSSKIKGQLIGGNLAILTSMLGSVSQIDTSDKILFIEEIGEYKYAIDRMLQSLLRAGYFNNLKAVIIGNMSNVKKNKTIPWGSSIEQLILDIVPKEIPVFFNFPAGHEAENCALIFGKEITISSNNNHYSISFKN